MRTSAWRDVAGAMLVGGLVVAVLPLWCWRTTGHLSPSPLALYRAQYIPYDNVGFGLDTTPPRLALTPLSADVYAEFAPDFAKHTVGALPQIEGERLAAVARDEWAGARVVLVPLVLVGVLAGGAAVWFGVLCAASLFVAYSFYAHWPGWTLYYFEALPVAGALAAVGLSRVRERLASLHWWRGRVATTGAMAVSAGLCAMLLVNLRTWRQKHIDDARYDTAFHQMIEKLPFRGAVVFVRYAENMHPHTNVVGNSATLGEDRNWVVVDDPTRNAAVLHAAAGRIPLLFEERGSSVRVYRELLDEVGSAGASRNQGER